jgi:cytochrome c556
MYRTIKMTVLATAIALAGTILLGACASDANDGKTAIEQRRALMKSISKNFKPIKAYAKSGKGSAADVVKHANAINASTGKVLALFPKGTGRGDFSDKETRALPAIWKDWAGFEKANKTLADESAKLASIAAGGDQKAIAKQAGAMGKLGCGGCHKPFRGAKVK